MRRLFAPLSLGQGGAVEEDDPPIDVVEEEEITAVANPTGERPVVKVSNGLDVAQASGDIDVPDSDGRPEPVRADTSDAIPIDDEWLEEAEEMAVPEPMKKTVSEALREIEAESEKKAPKAGKAK